MSGKNCAEDPQSYPPPYEQSIGHPSQQTNVTTGYPTKQTNDTDFYPAAGQSPHYQPQQYTATTVYQQPQGQQYAPPVTSTTVYMSNNRAPLSSPPTDCLVFSILTTVFCCFWIGIAAIIKSVESRNAAAVGNAPLAQAAGNTAKIINIVNAVVGLLFWTGIIVYYVVVISSVRSTTSIYYG